MQVHINIDGGSRGNPGIGAAAYVITAMEGEILAQEGYFMPHCTNNQAEYTALKLALLKAKELGAKELFIESDSLLLVKQFLGEYKIKNPDLQARMKIIRILQRPFTIHIRHVLREFNKAADALANEAMDERETLGFNAIKRLPSDAEILLRAICVNGVQVRPVVREEPDPDQTTGKKPHQPDLFE